MYYTNRAGECIEWEPGGWMYWMWSGRVEEAQNKRLTRTLPGNTQNTPHVEKLHYNVFSFICQRIVCFLNDCPLLSMAHSYEWVCRHRPDTHRRHGLKGWTRLHGNPCRLTNAKITKPVNQTGVKPDRFGGIFIWWSHRRHFYCSDRCEQELINIHLHINARSRKSCCWMKRIS